ncbi:hypothetical protein [Caldimonas sp. KR1-144]|uniref:hypothetical protein n=1 Tax=Caldimonas sp. KR1-144 TaxID=3400911 RepID=UPI003C123DB3
MALSFGADNGGGTRYFTAPLPALVDGNWALLCWIRAVDFTGSGFQYALSMGTLGGANSLHVFTPEASQASGNTWTLRALGSTGTEVNFGIGGAGVEFPNDGVDRLCVIQRVGTSLQIYVVPEGSTVASGGISGSTTWTTGAITAGTLNIGRRADGAADRGWQNPLGQIALLLNDSLTTDEINTLATGKPITAVRATTAMDLRFRTDNATEPDLSGNGRNATRVGTGFTVVTDFFADTTYGFGAVALNGVASQGTMTTAATGATLSGSTVIATITSVGSATALASASGATAVDRFTQVAAAAFSVAAVGAAALGAFGATGAMRAEVQASATTTTMGGFVLSANAGALVNAGGGGALDAFDQVAAIRLGARADGASALADFASSGAIAAEARAAGGAILAAFVSVGRIGERHVQYEHQVVVMISAPAIYVRLPIPELAVSATHDDIDCAVEHDEIAVTATANL